LGISVHGNPSPTELLRNSTYNITAAEGIENKLSPLREELDEELGNISNETRRVGAKRVRLAGSEIGITARCVGRNNDIRRNGAPMPNAPVLGDHVFTGPNTVAVAILE
jgi:hypothetical protein